jgi:hypothetical protein
MSLWQRIAAIGAGFGILAGSIIAGVLLAFCTGQTVSGTETLVIGIISVVAGLLIGALFAAGSVIGDVFCYAALHGSD